MCEAMKRMQARRRICCSQPLCSAKMLIPEIYLALQAAVTKLRNDAVVVPLNQQGPLNASGAAQQGADEGLQLSSVDPDLADATVAANSKAAEIKGGAGAGDAGGKGTGETGWVPGKNPKGMRIEDAFRESGPASMGLRGSGQVCGAASIASCPKSRSLKKPARASVCVQHAVVQCSASAGTRSREGELLEYAAAAEWSCGIFPVAEA